MTKYLSNNEWLKLFLIISLSFVAVYPSIYYLSYGYVADFLLTEGGVYESVGAAACLIAGVISFGSFRSLLNQKNSLGAFWILLFSIVCLFIAAEEVSWGQHLFNYDLPSGITSTNFQRELNLHNSMLIQSSNNNLSSILFKLLMLYFIVLPMFLTVFPTIEKMVRKTMIPIPSMLISLIALSAKAGDIVNYKIIYGSSFQSDRLRLGEAGESIFELCLLILAMELVYSLKDGVTYSESTNVRV